jgi:hypothetical protein
LFILLPHYTQHTTSNTRIKRSGSFSNCIQGTDQFTCANLFEHIPDSASTNSIHNQFIVGIGREHNHLGFGSPLNDSPACLNPAVAWHPNIHDHDIRFMPPTEGHSALGGACFADDLNIWKIFQHCPKP